MSNHVIPELDGLLKTVPPNRRQVLRRLLGAAGALAVLPRTTLLALEQPGGGVRARVAAAEAKAAAKGRAAADPAVAPRETGLETAAARGTGRATAAAKAKGRAGHSLTTKRSQ